MIEGATALGASMRNFRTSNQELSCDITYPAKQKERTCNKAAIFCDLYRVSPTVRRKIWLFCLVPQTNTWSSLAKQSLQRPSDVYQARIDYCGTAGWSWAGRPTGRPMRFCFCLLFWSVVSWSRAYIKSELV